MSGNLLLRGIQYINKPVYLHDLQQIGILHAEWNAKRKPGIESKNGNHILSFECDCILTDGKKISSEDWDGGKISINRYELTLENKKQTKYQQWMWTIRNSEITFVRDLYFFQFCLSSDSIVPNKNGAFPFLDFDETVQSPNISTQNEKKNYLWHRIDFLFTYECMHMAVLH